jgi:hypothetical protein
MESGGYAGMADERVLHVADSAAIGGVNAACDCGGNWRFGCVCGGIQEWDLCAASAAFGRGWRNWWVLALRIAGRKGRYFVVLGPKPAGLLVLVKGGRCRTKKKRDYSLRLRIVIG